jgi:hypothetical protein
MPPAQVAKKRIKKNQKNPLRGILRLITKPKRTLTRSETSKATKTSITNYTSTLFEIAACA